MRSERDVVILSGRSVLSQGMIKNFISSARCKVYCKEKSCRSMHFSLIPSLFYSNMLPSSSCTYLYQEIYQITWPFITRLWIGSLCERHAHVFFSLTVKHVTSSRLQLRFCLVTYNLLTKAVIANDMEHDFTLITNLMHWLLFIHKILFSSTCFEHQVLIFRRTQLYTSSIWYRHSL